MLSPSSRRAWIEIRSLDVNGYRGSQVALLAEGVDRNPVAGSRPCNNNPSPSSRRAWIEISQNVASRHYFFVALLAEGVDRNGRSWSRSMAMRSPSSRRAWIEMPRHGCPQRSGHVALLAEGVDRNRMDLPTPSMMSRRPPRGGRG